MLTDNGVIITDNVLFMVMLLMPKLHLNELRIWLKINTYNQWLVNQTEYDTEFFPIGDGIAISVKSHKGKGN